MGCLQNELSLLQLVTKRPSQFTYFSFELYMWHGMIGLLTITSLAFLSALIVLPLATFHLPLMMMLFSILIIESHLSF